MLTAHSELARSLPGSQRVPAVRENFLFVLLLDAQLVFADVHELLGRAEPRVRTPLYVGVHLAR